MATELLQRLVASGRVSAPNYFNGRLLAAGDLQQERDAGRELLRRVARAAGHGVVSGFEVASGSAAGVVRVSPGLALGPYGDALQLDDEIELAVAPEPTRPAPRVAAPDAGFRRCLPPPTGPTDVTNPGLHLLAVGPARGRDGTVPTSGLGGAVGSCALKDDVCGLRFVLLPFRNALEESFRDTDAAGGAAAQRSRFRSRMARACFGVGPAFPPAAGAVDPPPPFGPLAAVTDPKLPACHVPLAAVSLTTAGVEFVDMWAARRGVAAPTAAGGWGPWLSGHGRVEAEAMTLAFQSRVEELVRQPAPESLAAEDWFTWLPPVGVVPVTGVGDSVGVSYQRFFQAVAYREPTYVPVGLFATVLDEALRCPPTPLGGRGKPLVWLYRVRENMQPFAFKQANPPRPVMAFASGFARFLGDARYDVGQWDFGNFA